jgi:rare lipoprotein A
MRKYIFAAALILALLASATGCTTARLQPSPTAPMPPPLVTPSTPVDLLAIPDAVPRYEPRSVRGNPAFYDVFGKRYFVMPSPNGYVERGVASWYGPGFHAARTSNGERYDMYAMSAAHKTLPLPAYARVTNLTNGKSVVVRVNDRGPFKEGRIIDLSYTAATKLDMLKSGTALVEVRNLTPETAAAPPPPRPAELYVQAGAFQDRNNAQRLVDRLQSSGHARAFLRDDSSKGKPFYQVRVGPIDSAEEFDRTVAQLKTAGLTDARLAVD